MYKFKRVLAIGVIVIMMVTLLAGCSGREVYKDIDDSDVGRFKKVYTQTLSGGYYISIYVESETRVIYAFVKDGYGGGLTVMVDENGKPLLWEDWEGGTK